MLTSTMKVAKYHVMWVVFQVSAPVYVQVASTKDHVEINDVRDDNQNGNKSRERATWGNYYYAHYADQRNYLRVGALNRSRNKIAVPSLK